jgi:hypothetical protein
MPVTRATDLLSRYSQERLWKQRDELAYKAIWSARENEEAVKLGIAALSDRAQHVRYHACLLVAYSLRADLLPVLRQRLATIPASSQDDLAAAIDAIESGNHNYFVDRDHSGMITLNSVPRANASTPGAADHTAIHQETAHGSSID